MHAEGIGIAIDDFGTGYASLRYLATLPISALKIDRSFTAGLPENKVCRNIINAVAGLAADLDLSCVVEGIETQAQRDALPSGVQLQGYLVGRPQRPDLVDLSSLADRGSRGG
jgi:EAL domain-containing protein (putative c-di-GMP-specific phosphodiesterase class I)